MSELEEIETMLEPIESKIDSALEKENLTQVALSNLKDMYLSLKIESIDDLESQTLVKEGKKVCVKLRTGTITACKIGREKAIKEQKLWLAKEKEIVAEISIVESHLDSEIKRIEQEKKEIEAQKVQPFVEQFKFYGKEVKAIDLIDKPMTVILTEIEQAKEEYFEKKRIEEQRIENERKEKELAEREAKMKAFEEEQERKRLEEIAKEDSIPAPTNLVEELIDEVSSQLVSPIKNSFLDEIANEEPKDDTTKSELTFNCNFTVLANAKKLSFYEKLNINQQQELYELLLSYTQDIKFLANENIELKKEISELNRKLSA